MIALTILHLSRIFFYWRFFYISFQQKNEIKKRKTLMEFKYLLFCSNIDLFDIKDFKRNLTDGNLIRKCMELTTSRENVFQKKFDVAVFMVRRNSLGNGLWVVNTAAQNHARVFSNNELFIAITRQVLKAHFVWKKLKVDYSKNIWKEENRRYGFVCILVGYISEK